MHLSVADGKTMTSRPLNLARAICAREQSRKQWPTSRLASNLFKSVKPEKWFIIVCLYSRQ